MSDAEWDADDFEPQEAVKSAVSTDKWEGEDEDNDVKDNWDDEDAEEGENKENDDQATVQVKKKKSLKERIAEKEEKRRKELELKKEAEEAARAALTPEELAAEKLRQQKLQEDSDFELAKGLVGADDLKGGDTIDAMNPSSKDDFNKFAEMLKTKISKSETSAHYSSFLETLFRDLCLSCECEDIKRIASTLNALANEKAKQQKGPKSKKKAKGKVNLKAGKTSDFGDYDVEAMDEFDDFI